MVKGENESIKGRHNNILTRYLRFKTMSVLILIIIAVVSLLLLFKCTDNRFEIISDNKINLTPLQITSIKETGEWEFLSIEDEEIVDTIRKGWFGDDSLIRIYYGTMRLGFNMNDVEEGWISTNNDTIKVILPKIRLLDENFIDEARTKSFYQSGRWSDEDRALMLASAKTKMKSRGLSVENIKTAEDNAKIQIKKMIENIIGNNRAFIEVTIKDKG